MLINRGNQPKAVLPTFLPTCQVRVVRLHVSWPPPPPPPPDLNSKLVIAVVPAGPEQKTQNQSGPCRTSTASARSQWSQPDPNSKPRIRVAPPDLNCKLVIAVVPAAPEQKAQDQSGPCRTSTASARSQSRAQTANRSGPCRARRGSPGPECSQPDLDHKESSKI